MSLNPDCASACTRALATLPATPTAELLAELVRLASNASLEESGLGLVGRAPQPEQRVLLAMGLSLLDPTLCADSALEAHFVEGLQELAPRGGLSEPFVYRWTHALLDAVDRDPARLRWVQAFFARQRLGGGLLSSAVRRLVEAGELDQAEALIQYIPWTEKYDRGLALTELGLARGEGLGAAFEAIVGTETITTGTGRGHDELYALGAVLRRALAEVGARPDLRPLVARMIRYGEAGQRQLRPTGFAQDLAEAARACAEAAGADCSEWLEHGQALHAAIALDELAGEAEASIERAKARIDAGQGAPPPEPEWLPRFEPRPPPDSAWRVQDELVRRVRDATQVMAKAHSERDWQGFFDALAVGLSPAGPTYESSVRAWRDAPEAEAGAALLELFEREPTPDNYWCVRSSHEPWEALSQVQDVALARALIELMLERDFVSRAYARSRAWDFPRSISWEVAGLCVRVGDQALVERLLQRIRSQLGEPLPEIIATLCGSYAQGGRFEEALTLSEHPKANVPRPPHYHPRDVALFPPTQGALLAIANSGLELTPAQAKLLIRRMKAAPRLPREGHTMRLRELREALAR
jgi:hypothetical protein